ncbi:serine/arginine repetitive matrix protein 2 isoform X2 [Hyalella azteca]|uniref:Serine/arginine repetitive matrix protein 2 isoform X2 n=1 Tax=Hyalella azteca TaxID=294128 RepID=A0A979FS24_HYAAZ|nr:serine/arginine repetitive matrix protein 2 isoform X2 [Hyalella azteca]
MDHPLSWLDLPDLELAKEEECEAPAPLLDEERLPVFKTVKVAGRALSSDPEVMVTNARQQDKQLDTSLLLDALVSNALSDCGAPAESSNVLTTPNFSKRVPAEEDSNKETSATDFSRESSQSSVCRIPLSGRGKTGQKNYASAGSPPGKTTGKAKGNSGKKKTTQTRRSRNSRAGKIPAEHHASGSSSSDCFEDDDWLPDRPITRNFCSNIDKIINRAARSRKSKSRNKINETNSQDVSSSVANTPGRVSDSVELVEDEERREGSTEPSLATGGPVLHQPATDVTMINAEHCNATETYQDDILGEDLSDMFPIHLNEAIEETGLNISDLALSSSCTFEDLRCNGNPVGEVVVQFSDVVTHPPSSANSRLLSKSDVISTPRVQLSHESPTSAAKSVHKTNDLTNSSSAAPIVPVSLPQPPISLKKTPQPLINSVAAPSSSSRSVENLSSMNSSVLSRPSPGYHADLSATPNGISGPDGLPSLVTRDDTAAIQSPVPGTDVRPGSVVLAIIDASGNLVAVPNTCMSLEEINSAVTSHDLRSSLASLAAPAKTEVQTINSEMCPIMDIKPSIHPSSASNGVKSNQLDVNLFSDDVEVKTEKFPEVLEAHTAACPPMDQIRIKAEPDSPCWNSTAVKSPPFVAVKCEVEPCDEARVNSPRTSPLKKAYTVKKEVHSSPDRDDSVISAMLDQSQTETLEKPPEQLGKLHLNIGSRQLSASPAFEVVIVGPENKIKSEFSADFTTDFKNHVAIDSDCGRDANVNDTCEPNAIDGCSKPDQINSGSDSNDPTTVQSIRKKIKVSDYFKRKSTKSAAEEENSNLPVDPAFKHETKIRLVKKASEKIQQRPKITNIKSMLSKDIPSYSSPVDVSGKQTPSAVILKSETGTKDNRAVHANSNSKCPPAGLKIEAKQNNVEQQIEKNKTETISKNGIFKITKPSNVTDSIPKSSAATQKETAGRAQKRLLTSQSNATVNSDSAPSSANKISSCSESSATTQPIDPNASPPSQRPDRSSNNELDRGRRSSSQSSSSSSTSSCDSRVRTTRRRKRARSSLTMSPVPRRKKRAKRSRSRHKSRRRDRKRSRSSSGRSRSSSQGRRHRRHRYSLSPSKSRSRSSSYDRYKNKKRSNKRARYSRSRSRSFSPNTVYRVGCACGGGDPKFVGHLPSCQHFQSDINYRTPELQNYYMHPQFHHQMPPHMYPTSPSYPYSAAQPYFGYSADYCAPYAPGRHAEYEASSYARTARPISSAEQALRMKEVEERLVVYVGRIPEDTTKDSLRERFKKFGTITNVSLHFRDRGDNYGFVTFMNSTEANRAIENGNKGEALQFDLCFGGRRQFCRQQYKDLDAQPAVGGASDQSMGSYDALLAMMKARPR